MIYLLTSLWLWCWRREETRYPDKQCRSDVCSSRQDRGRIRDYIWRQLSRYFMTNVVNKTWSMTITGIVEPAALPVLQQRRCHKSMHSADSAKLLSPNYSVNNRNISIFELDLHFGPNCSVQLMPSFISASPTVATLSSLC